MPDLVVEAAPFGSRLAADEENPVALFGLGADRLLARAFDPRGDLDRIVPGLFAIGIVGFLGALLHDGFGAFGLPGPLAERARHLIVKMNNGRRNAARAG